MNGRNRTVNLVESIFVVELFFYLFLILFYTLSLSIYLRLLFFIRFIIIISKIINFLVYERKLSLKSFALLFSKQSTYTYTRIKKTTTKIILAAHYKHSNVRIVFCLLANSAFILA